MAAASALAAAEAMEVADRLYRGETTVRPSDDYRTTFYSDVLDTRGQVILR